jgi:hypothetical protein
MVEVKKKKREVHRHVRIMCLCAVKQPLGHYYHNNILLIVVVDISALIVVFTYDGKHLYVKSVVDLNLLY